MHNRFHFIVLCKVFFVFAFVLIQQANSQININETFKTSNIDPSIIYGDQASFTAGNVDPQGDGWLRLTSSAVDQHGFMYIDKNLPSNLGVRIDFEYKTWRYAVPDLTGADGFTVFLFDASVPFRLGGYGGSLGYAPGLGAPQGLAGGYVGIGFDEYGNFSNPTQGRNGGPGLRCNSVTLRGPTDNGVLTTNSYLTSIQLQPDELSTVNSIGYPNMVAQRPSDGLFYRRVKINIIPNGSQTNPKYTISVSWRTSPNGNDRTLLTYQTNVAPPANLKLGFAASSAGHVNCHEIRNLVVNTPVGVSVHKTVDKSIPRVGENVTYTVNVLNSTAAPISNLLFTDSVKLHGMLTSNDFTLNSITFNNNGTVGNTAAGYTSGVPVTTGLTNPFNATLSMQPNSSGTFTIVGTIKNDIALEGKILLNTAVVDPSKTGIVDKDLTDNNSSAVSTIAITTPDLQIQKTVNKPCADIQNENIFTIIVSNISTVDINRTNPTQIIVTDTIPVGLTVVKTAGVGWTVSNIGNIYKFIRSGALLANASFDPIVITVKPSTGKLSWTNTAYVTTLASINEKQKENNKSSVTISKTPPTPLLNSPIRYNQGDIATPLSSGKNLIWYSSIGSNGSTTPPTPTTDTPGTTSYYVSQSNGNCESSLAKIDVIVTKVTLVTACNSYTAADGTVYTTSGIKSVRTKDILGNDSIYSINLIIKKSTSSTQNITVCDVFTDTDNTVYNSSQQIKKVIPNSAGCDSTIIINLTVNKSSSETLNIVSCDSYTAPDGIVHTSSGIKTAILKRVNGCDSTITIILTVNKSTSKSMDLNACDSYTAPDGTIYTNSGLFTISTKTIAGCDSIVNVNLTINKSTRISQDIKIFEGENLLINGKTYSKEGVYTDVLVSKNGCDSVVISDVKMVELPNTISPNGDSKNDKFMEGWHVKIYNRNGILLFEGHDGWDGTQNGVPVAKDTYYYVLYYESTLPAKTKGGFINVVR